MLERTVWILDRCVALAHIARTSDRLPLLRRYYFIFLFFSVPLLLLKYRRAPPEYRHLPHTDAQLNLKLPLDLVWPVCSDAIQFAHHCVFMGTCKLHTHTHTHCQRIIKENRSAYDAGCCSKIFRFLSDNLFECVSFGRFCRVPTSIRYQKMCSAP